MQLNLKKKNRDIRVLHDQGIVIFELFIIITTHETQYYFFFIFFYIYFLYLYNLDLASVQQCYRSGFGRPLDPDPNVEKRIGS